MSCIAICQHWATIKNGFPSTWHADLEIPYKGHLGGIQASRDTRDCRDSCTTLQLVPRMCTQVPFPGKWGCRKVGLVATQISAIHLGHLHWWGCTNDSTAPETGGTSFRGLICRQGCEIPAFDRIACPYTQWKKRHLQRVRHLTFFLLHSLGTQLEDSSVSQWPKRKGWTFETHEDLPGELSYWEADKEVFVWSTHFVFNLRVLQSYCGWPDLFGCKQQCGVLGPLLLRTNFFLYSQPASSKPRSIYKRKKLGQSNISNSNYCVF